MEHVITSELSEARTVALTEKSHRLRESLWAMIVVALLLRLVTAGFLLGGVLKPRRDHWPFGYETGRIARAIVSGQGFSNPLFETTGPTAWMTPVYPYLLAGVFRLFGVFTAVSAWVILGLDGLFSALTCLPVVWMARRSFGQEVAVWAGWTWALFPYAVYLSAGFVWENTLTCLLLSLLFVWTFRLEQPDRLAAWVGYGLLWGFAALVNPVALSVLPFLAGWACFRLHRRRERWLLPACSAALGLVVGVAPWMVRNYQGFHQFIPLRDNFWLEVRVGNNGDTLNWWTDAAHPSNNDQELAEYDRLGELAYMAEKKHEAIAFLESRPGLFAWMSFRRFVYTWTGYWSFAPGYLAEESFDPWNVPFSVSLTLLMLVGLRRASREAKGIAAPYAFMLVVFPLVYYVTHPELRYRHPIDPQIVVLAVYAVIGYLGGKRQPQPTGNPIEP